MTSISERDLSKPGCGRDGGIRIGMVTVSTICLQFRWTRGVESFHRKGFIKWQAHLPSFLWSRSMLWSVSSVQKPCHLNRLHTWEKQQKLENSRVERWVPGLDKTNQPLRTTQPNIPVTTEEIPAKAWGLLYMLNLCRVRERAPKAAPPCFIYTHYMCVYICIYM